MSTAKVFVGSLPPGCKPEELRHLFTNYGVVVECDIMNRCGFVHLETIEMAEAAIAALNGIEFKGQSIVVEPGRPKDKRGGGGAGNRRPMQGHGGGNFNRGGHMGGNNFRGGGGNRAPNSNDSHFGPVRNESNFRQQRNAPYSKGLPQQHQNFDGPPQAYKNKFNQGVSNTNHNDFHSGIFSGGGGGNQRVSIAGGSGPSPSIGQDRRGFALPADHQQQQQVSFGGNQGRFGNGPMVPNGHNSDSGLFQRNRNNPGMNGGSTQSGRGGFNSSRGEFAGRGGFSARRGAGSGASAGPNSNMPQNHGGSFNKHGPATSHSHNASNAYQSEFPPLGNHGGGVPGNRNRFNGPRQGLNMGGNRRF